MKLAKLYNEIKEAFDFQNIKSVKIRKLSKFVYESEDGRLDVKFADVSDIAVIPVFLQNATEIYNVEYKIDERDDQAYKTDFKEFIGILKGVKDAIDDFISSNQPDILLIISADRGGSFTTDSTKDKIYKYAILKNLPTDYNADTDVIVYDGLDTRGIRMYKKTIRETLFANH